MVIDLKAEINCTGSYWSWTQAPMCLQVGGPLPPRALVQEDGGRQCRARVSVHTHSAWDLW